ncbi:MAG: HAMP domain-containing histidine kinase, partial [Bifidobacteriaceae bacterium]|nr:HAMP domain-containing histidine kinase [Bifidobacteriaceae bacterium]
MTVTQRPSSAANGKPEAAPTGRRGLPLRLRLAAIIAVLLCGGLILAGVANVLLLRQALMSQVDAQLATAMQSIQTLDATVRNPGPTDYVVMTFTPEGTPLGTVPPAGRLPSGGPLLANLTPTTAIATTEPFTLPSTDGPGRWRVRTAQIDYRFGTGAVALGMSLNGMDQTIRQMWFNLGRTATIAVIVGTATGFWLVRRSLRPLSEVEVTAAAIAAGDLTQRVPPAPAGTEVGALTDSLNGMLTQIESAFAIQSASERRMRQFISDASHELRTPLAAIRGYGELYRIGALSDPDELAGAMRRIEDEAARMGYLVGDLLQLTRLDEGQAMRREEIDLQILAADAAADLKALDPSRSVRVVGLGDDDAVTVIGDSQRLRQVLANLVGNVERHTPRGSPVEIAVGGEPGASGNAWAAGVLEVRDHGPGIPEDLAAKVFERFFR